jgi:hypothetical protein
MKSLHSDVNKAGFWSIIDGCKKNEFRWQRLTDHNDESIWKKTKRNVQRIHGRYPQTTHLIWKQKLLCPLLIKNKQIKRALLHLFPSRWFNLRGFWLYLFYVIAFDVIITPYGVQCAKRPFFLLKSKLNWILLWAWKSVEVERKSVQLSFQLVSAAATLELTVVQEQLICRRGEFHRFRHPSAIAVASTIKSLRTKWSCALLSYSFCRTLRRSEWLLTLVNSELN